MRKIKTFDISLSSLFMLAWGYIWRLSVSCVTAVMGTLLYAVVNEKLSIFESEIHGIGTWKWDVFSWVYFAVLIGFIIWIWAIWYKKE